MTEETTTEQLAEIDRDMAEIERQVAELVEEAQRADYKTQELPEYTPPGGWRVLAVGEVLREGDMWVWPTDDQLRQTVHIGAVVGANQRYIRPIEPDKPQPQPAEYTPPEGWRVVQVGEVLRDGDLWVNHEGELWPTKRVGERVNDERYIRPIESQAEPEPVQVREGRWRTRNGLAKDVTAMPTDHEDFAAAYPWWDGVSTWRDDGRWLAGGSTMDLVEYLGPIEADKTQELPDKTQELPEYTPPEGWRLVRFGELLLPGDEIVQIDDRRRYPTHRIGDAVGPNQQYIRRIKPEPQAESHTEQQIEELRSEVSYVQNLLGTERRRVTQLEELVASLRAINEAQEKAFTAAGKENTALRNQLAAVASVAADRQRLLIELDAAQQVPADSPELRQLRADLEQVTRERDQHLDSYQRIFGDLETIRETTKAAAVEAIAEWLEPVRLVDHPNLSNETLQHLPQIMRHLTGLDSHAID